MGCTSAIVKYLVFLFNFIFVLAGITLLVIGILSKLKLDETTPSGSNIGLGAGPILIITVGTLTFFIAFLGCCGAIRESKCMLTTYAVILLGILILQIAAGVYSFVVVKDANDEFKNVVLKELRKTFDQYKHNTEATKYFDDIQQSFECCGIVGPQDYLIDIPSSCCIKGTSCTISNNVHQKGCVTFVYDAMKKAITTIGYVALGLCVTELIATIFSLCLVSSIRNEERRSGYA